ncbi:MAG TPA: RNA 2',3'-cyclic phosphodiesterase [Chloroflexaceae bacterium]|nr:RNA 2',3'-cyclic phosphodiesterase [Chloroflexaceae bacterium]
MPVRLVGPEGMHLTLQFLGETDGALVGPLVAGLAGLPTTACRLSLAGLGAFPTARQPQVIWAGVGGDTEALAALRREVAAATGALGLADEARQFRPHLTLGRVRQGVGPAERRAVAEALARTAPPAPLAWEAGRPALFQSALTPRGAVYTRLGP